jgi:type II secretory pathway pseudopilin PulG
VITILAILGTIGFLSIGGYSSRARDSARIGDTAQITKSLDLAIVTSGAYPAPDNAFSVTYSGGVVWNQGTVGSNVMQYFKGTIMGGGINKKPVDPLRNTEYTYSSLAEGKAYQIKAEYEGELTQNAIGEKGILDTAFAAPGNPTIAYIRGNYG